MPKINEEQRLEISSVLNRGLVEPVGILLFTRAPGVREEKPPQPICEYCEEVEELLSELVDLSDRLSLEVLDFDADRDAAERFGVDRVPALIPIGKEDRGIRYYGMPSGYEFTPFIQALLSISSGKARLSDESLDAISAVSKPIDIKVFVTTTCPYCPSAAGLAYQLALASDFISAEVIEVAEFPELIEAYGIIAVPKILMNEKVSMVGAPSEEEIVRKAVDASQAQAA